MLMLLSLLLPWPASGAEDAPAREDMVAVFVLRLPAYVDWPPTALAPEEPVFIGMIGNSLSTPKLEKEIAQRPDELEFRQWPEADAISDDELAALHMVVFAAGSGGQLNPIAERLGQRPVLLIGEQANLAKRGAHVSQMALVVEHCDRLPGVSRAQQHQAGTRIEAFLRVVMKPGGDLDNKVGVAFDMAVFDVRVAAGKD